SICAAAAVVTLSFFFATATDVESATKAVMRRTPGLRMPDRKGRRRDMRISLSNPAKQKSCERTMSNTGGRPTYAAPWQPGGRCPGPQYCRLYAGQGRWYCCVRRHRDGSGSASPEPLP